MRIRIGHELPGMTTDSDRFRLTPAALASARDVTAMAAPAATHSRQQPTSSLQAEGHASASSAHCTRIAKAAVDEPVLFYQAIGPLG